MAKGQFDQFRAVEVLVIQFEFGIKFAAGAAHAPAVLDGGRSIAAVLRFQAFHGDQGDPMVGGEFAERNVAWAAHHHVIHEDAVLFPRDQAHVRKAAVRDVRAQLREIDQAEQDPAVTSHENQVAVVQVRRRPVIPGDFFTAITPRELGEQVQRGPRGQRG
jgi:hypothetical protein